MESEKEKTTQKTWTIEQFAEEINKCLGLLDKDNSQLKENANWSKLKVLIEALVKKTKRVRGKSWQ